MKLLRIFLLTVGLLTLPAANSFCANIRYLAFLNETNVREHIDRSMVALSKINYDPTTKKFVGPDVLNLLDEIYTDLGRLYIIGHPGDAVKHLQYDPEKARSFDTKLSSLEDVAFKLDLQDRMNYEILDLIIDCHVCWASIYNDTGWKIVPPRLGAPGGDDLYKSMR